MNEENKFIFDEESFIEQYHPDYNCQDIADSDDYSKVLHGDYDEDQEEYLREAGYLDMTINELREGQARVDYRIIKAAFVNYLRTNYPGPYKEDNED